VIDSAEGVRELKFDRYTESAISTESPYESLSRYTNYFHLAFLPQPRIKRALFIGAGGGIGPRSFHAHDGEMEIEVVDIDAKVLELARSHFHLEDSPRIKTIAADGRSYVRGAADGAYDCIVLDAFSIGGRIPFHLVTREFIAMCREKLARGGVFVMNINSALEGEKAQIFRSMYKTVAAAFPENAQAFALWRAEGQPPEYSTNVILVGIHSDEPASRAQWIEWADEYESASLISRADVARMVRDLVVTLPDLGDAPVFTDDYAPIETMPF
jgi:spermidine synthase